MAIKFGLENLNLASLVHVRTLLFYDMGATSTKATVVQYIPRSAIEDGGRDKTAGIVRVLGVGWDAELGGAAFTERIMKLLLRTADRRVSRDERALARLRQEANKAKEVRCASNRPRRAPLRTNKSRISRG